MRSYEKAPATRFLATRCACCGRKLVDALSVQTCVGPDCREMHGYDNAPGPADWAAVECFLTNFGASVKADNPEVVGCRDARKVCNVLVHRFAENFRTARWIPDALYALGFVKLAERCAKRAHVQLGGTLTSLAPLEVKVSREQYTDTFRGRTQTREVFVVKAPFSKDFNKTPVKGRWFDGTVKAWRVPVASRGVLWVALKDSFPGLPLTTPDGKVTTLPDPNAD